LERLVASTPLTGHEASAVVAFGFEGVVGSAAKRKVVAAVFATLCPWDDVGELESAGFVATAAVVADEGAAPLVALPHFSL
jgi:hypothetical protein